MENLEAGKNFKGIDFQVWTLHKVVVVDVPEDVAVGADCWSRGAAAAAGPDGVPIGEEAVPGAEALASLPDAGASGGGTFVGATPDAGTSRGATSGEAVPDVGRSRGGTSRGGGPDRGLRIPHRLPRLLPGPLEKHQGGGVGEGGGMSGGQPKKNALLS